MDAPQILAAIGGALVAAWFPLALFGDHAIAETLFWSGTSLLVLAIIVGTVKA